MCDRVKPVLIVGAGPTGLLLALSLARRNTPFRIIDKTSGPGSTSRAIAVHARTLELYGQLGIADHVVSEGSKVQVIHVREAGELKGTLPWAINGVGLSPYAFALAYPQDAHERLLITKLDNASGRVERNTELKSIEQHHDGVSAVVVASDRTEETIECSYVCGADGAKSTVRHLSNISLPGGTYEQRFFVADVIVSRVWDDINTCFTGNDFSVSIKLGDDGQCRLIGTVPNNIAPDDVSFESVHPSVEKNTKLGIMAVNWFATYKVHHRVADHFRDRRVFLLGDAGHLHSPVGGQGMNTGIGDAVNLAWKLSAVLDGRANSTLLETYEADRMPFARLLVSTTDRIFTLIQDQGWAGSFIRRIFLPYIAPLLFKIPGVPKMAFLRASQILINYRDSPLSQGSTGTIRAGDRLPYVKNDDYDNFKSLTTLDWQLHVYGDVKSDLIETAKRRSLDIFVFPWSEASRAAGLQRDALYLIRPDGYIGFAQATADVVSLEAYMEGWGLVAARQ